MRRLRHRDVKQLDQCSQWLGGQTWNLWRKRLHKIHRETVYGILEKSLLFYILASDSWTSLHLSFPIYNQNHINPISYMLLGSKYLSTLLFLSRAYPYTSALSAIRQYIFGSPIYLSFVFQLTHSLVMGKSFCTPSNLW